MKPFAPALAGLVVLGLLAVPPARPAEYNQVLPEKSRVSFLFRQMGVPVEGRFGRVNAQIAFDPATPQAGRAQIEIDLGAADAGGPEANEELKSKNWFNLAQFPKASFVSTGVKPLGAERYEAIGKLTIKGRSKDVVVPFTFKPEGAQGVFEGSFPLKRLEYGVGGGPWGDTDTVADEVQVKFRFQVAAAAAAKK